MKRSLLGILSSSVPGQTARLYRVADAVRRHYMGDEVYVRGIVEFSNICANNCLYCGLRAENTKVRRYLMTEDEIMLAVHQTERRGQTTVVLQSGEAPAFGDQALGKLVRRIKRETNLAVTLSVGNRPRATYALWRDCGMDRYLLRFECSDPKLFSALHLGDKLSDRLTCLEHLRALGVQVGSGFLIGVPGETLDILADNILLCRALNLDMIGIGPFIAHPDTPLGCKPNAYADDPEMFFRALAALRIYNSRAHIPATTAYDAFFPGIGRDLALQRGANVFMPNNTPSPYRDDYHLYPGKPVVDADEEELAQSVLKRLARLGRVFGAGPGHSIKSKRGVMQGDPDPDADADPLTMHNS